MYKFKLFGELLIEQDHKPATIMNSPKGAALLVYLILQKEMVSRELIADLFWEATSTQQSLTSLRALIRRVRKLVPGIVTTRQQIGFEAGLETFIDIYQLQTALNSDDLTQIDEALLLYKGEFLAGYYLEDAPRFNEWLILEREQWRQQIIAAYMRLCTAYTKQENWSRGIAVAQRWLALDNVDETPLQFLLQFLGATGQFDLALKQYEVSRQRLWDEFGVEPVDETLQLVQQLRQLKDSQSSIFVWRDMIENRLERPSANQLADIGQLPNNAYVPYQRNKDFTGRESSLLQLAKLLLPPTNDETHGHRAVAITGMGGLGKSQLAVEFCYRYGRFFPGGVFWLSFADTDSVPEEISHIGGERGMSLYNETDNLKQVDKIGRVSKAWQEPIPRLLIFDNCEEEALLTNWLPVSGGCSVLLTSRRAYWSPELQVVEHALSTLAEKDSVRLLQHSISTITQSDALSIAHELGHLPLALHLAGSFLRRYRQITAIQYLNQLRDKTLLEHPSLQGRGVAISPTGHELSVARTFAVNWEQLDPTDETDALALQLLAHAVQFAPGEPLRRKLLISTVSIDTNDLMQLLLVEDGITRLISLGFVNADGADYLTIHQLVVAFVNTRLTNVEVIETAVALAIEKQVRSYFSIHDTHDKLPFSATHYLHILETELFKQTPVGAFMAHNWGLHLMDIGDLANARLYLEKAVAISEKQFGENDIETAHILRALITIIWQIDSAQAAKPYAERALAIYQTAYGNDEHVAIAQSLNNLAIIHARLGESKEAISNYQQALGILEKLEPENNLEIPRINFNLGIVYYRQGNFNLALSHYTVALTYYREILPPDHPQLTLPLMGISLVQLLIGNYNEAYELSQETLALQQARFGENHPQTSTTLSICGAVLHFMNNSQQAIDYLRKALAIREKIYGKQHIQLMVTLTWLGYVLSEAGHLAEARLYLERGVTIQDTEKVINEQTAEIITRLAELNQKEGNTAKALTLLKRAMTIWDNQAEKHPHTAVTLTCLGEWHEGQGELKLAKRYYEQAQHLWITHVTEHHYERQRVTKNLAKLAHTTAVT